MRHVQLKLFAALMWQCRWCSYMLHLVNKLADTCARQYCWLI